MSKTIKLAVAGVVGVVLLAGVLVAANFNESTEPKQNDTTQEPQTVAEEDQTTQTSEKNGSVVEPEIEEDSSKNRNSVDDEDTQEMVDNAGSEEWTGEIDYTPLNKEDFDFYLCPENQPGSGMYRYQRNSTTAEGDPFSTTVYIDNKNLFSRRTPQMQEGYNRLYQMISADEPTLTITNENTLIYPFNCEGKVLNDSKLEESIVYQRETLSSGITGYYANENFYFVNGSNIVWIIARESNLNNRNFLDFDQFNQIVSDNVKLQK